MKRVMVEMSRKQKLQLIYRNTHRDFKGKLETGEKAILIWRDAHGTCLVPLNNLTDKEIDQRLKKA